MNTTSKSLATSKGARKSAALLALFAATIVFFRFNDSPLSSASKPIPPPVAALLKATVELETATGVFWLKTPPPSPTAMFPDTVEFKTSSDDDASITATPPPFTEALLPAMVELTIARLPAVAATPPPVAAELPVTSTSNRSNCAASDRMAPPFPDAASPPLKVRPRKLAWAVVGWISKIRKAGPD